MEQPSEKVWIAKRDDPQRLVFGWANIAVAKSTGKQFADLHGHTMNTQALEDAAYDFVLDFAGVDNGGVHHEGEAVSRLVEIFMSTPEKLEAMGAPKGSLPTGLWVGFKVPPDVYKRVQDGELRSFSIQGVGEVTETP